jgi:hypothetical protein
MNTKTGFDYIVNAAVDNTEKELMKNYTENTVVQVVKNCTRCYRVLIIKPIVKVLVFLFPP